MVLVPIFVRGVFWGALGADACTTAREWNSSEIDTLRTFADIGGALIQRDEAKHSLETSEARFRAVDGDGAGRDHHDRRGRPD